MTVAAAFRSGVAELAGAPTDTPTLEAAVLLADALGVSKERLFARMGDPVGARGMASFRRALELRRSAVPVAYIRGAKEFYGHVFSVDRRVLIPRPDTECLVEAALAAVAADPSVRRVHDVGTGSGVLAIVAALRGARRVRAVDTDADAVRTARANVARNACDDRVSVMHGRLPLHGCDPADVLVANIVADTHLRSLDHYRAAVRRDGRVILGGIAATRSAEMRAAVADHGFGVESALRRDGWECLNLSVPPPEGTAA